MKIRILYLTAIAFLTACNPKENNLISPEEVISIVEQSINDRKLSDLNPYFSKEAKIYEQGSIDDSWEQYRDGHLGHEIEAFESFNMNFEINETFNKDAMALVRGFYNLSAFMDGDSISSRGLVTFAMISEDSNWKIIHLQFSRSCR